eukprot:15010911-Alexandrium_andersonii.AAC.1
MHVWVALVTDRPARIDQRRSSVLAVLRRVRPACEEAFLQCEGGGGRGALPEGVPERPGSRGSRVL